jgi:NAD(P)-dependent dehydrogenase (short-subunit alcohol dehydrogenase family)
LSFGSGDAGAVLVAGGTGALGEAVVQDLLETDHRVVATWIAAAGRDNAAARFSAHDGLTLVRADVTDPESVAELVGAIPHLRAVVDLVGGFFAGPKVHESDPADFDRMLRLNLRPAFLLARAAMPHLVASGGASFVVVSARAALQPFAGAAGYVTAKAALLAFVRAFDVEYGASGVRCNAVLPGVIDTPANRRAHPDCDPSGWTSPAQIARVIRFLVDDDSTVIRGGAIPVHGSS